MAKMPRKEDERKGKKTRKERETRWLAMRGLPIDRREYTHKHWLKLNKRAGFPILQTAADLCTMPYGSAFSKG